MGIKKNKKREEMEIRHRKCHPKVQNNSRIKMIFLRIKSRNGRNRVKRLEQLLSKVTEKNLHLKNKLPLITQELTPI